MISRLYRIYLPAFKNLLFFYLFWVFFCWKRIYLNSGRRGGIWQCTLPTKKRKQIFFTHHSDPKFCFRMKRTLWSIDEHICNFSLSQTNNNCFFSQLKKFSFAHRHNNFVLKNVFFLNVVLHQITHWFLSYIGVQIKV